MVDAWVYEWVQGSHSTTKKINRGYLEKYS